MKVRAEQRSMRSKYCNGISMALIVFHRYMLLFYQQYLINIFDTDYNVQFKLSLLNYILVDAQILSLFWKLLIF